MFEETIRKNLLTIAEAYCRATDQTLTTFSKQFYGRGDFMRQFKAGEHTISIDRLGTMIRAIEAEWPDGAKRPAMRPIFMIRRK